MKINHIIRAAVLLAALATASRLLAADGKEIYTKDCAKCHGADGKGETKMGKKLGVKDYTSSKVQSEFTDEQAFKAVKEGLKDKAGKTLMSPATALSDADIKTVVAYVRTLKK